MLSDGRQLRHVACCRRVRHGQGSMQSESGRLVVPGGRGCWRTLHPALAAGGSAERHPAQVRKSPPDRGELPRSGRLPPPGGCHARRCAAALREKSGGCATTCPRAYSCGCPHLPPPSLNPAGAHYAVGPPAVLLSQPRLRHVRQRKASALQACQEPCLVQACGAGRRHGDPRRVGAGLEARRVLCRLGPQERCLGPGQPALSPTAHPGS